MNRPFLSYPFLMRHFLFTLFLSLLVFAGCNSPSPKTPPGAFEADSTDAAVLPSDGNQPSQADTGSAAPQGPSFHDICEAHASAVFMDEFKQVGLDELEDSPKFKQAREMVFLKYIRRDPIKNKFAGKIIPRIVWKGYKFPSQESLQSQLEEWLNEAEHSGDKIVLGVEVQALKVPPMVCAVVGAELYMMQTPCLYQGPEQDQLVERFMGEMKKAGAQYRFTVGCNGGQLSYMK